MPGSFVYVAFGLGNEYIRESSMTRSNEEVVSNNSICRPLCAVCNSRCKLPSVLKVSKGELVDELVRDWARSGIGSVYPAGRARIRTDIVTLTLELSPTNKTKRNDNLFRLLFRRVQRRLLPASFLIRTINFDLSQLRHACSLYPRLIKEESLLGFIFFLHLLFSHDSRTMGSDLQAVCGRGTASR
ncbi:hypothetical protein F2Q70_00029134 [Brassica cretica]|uniref:DC1-like C-terminal domain-containing protein n=1 Tax=Brassica cretica TaxID=69181 RepID=A0A8S9FN40_BRACR|nr:hypothetical protein F2Q70_00029134 [Brassica cretica]